MPGPFHRLSFVTLALLGATVVGGPRAARAQSWVFHGPTIEGSQLDAARGPNSTIHAVSSRYYQLDVNGDVLVNESVGDSLMCPLCFPPAIAVGDDGTVHVVTRGAGDYGDGVEIRYRRRASNGTWDQDYLFGSVVPRNYVVGAAWAGPGQVYLMSSEGGDDVWGDLHLWRANDGSASYLKSVGSIWRGDCDARLRGIDGRVFMVSGKPDGNGNAAYYLHGSAGTDLGNELEANKNTHVAGAGRTGFADLAVDDAGHVHLTFGAQQAVYYNKYTYDGSRVFASDIQLFTDLGWWHLESGLSAVGASDDGDTVVAVALRSDGSQIAGDSDLLWAMSLDGGATWSAAQDTGHNTCGGEGRSRPRLVVVGNKFFLFYHDNANAGGISLATLEVVVDRDNDSYTTEVDCDDSNPAIHPGAVELCNSVDDDCDETTDEGCDVDAGTDDLADAGTLATSDGGIPSDNPEFTVIGGCGCDTGYRGDSRQIWVLFGAVLLGLFHRGRRSVVRRFTGTARRRRRLPWRPWLHVRVRGISRTSAGRPSPTRCLRRRGRAATRMQ